MKYGYVPHSGSTYFLSKLPGEIGTFLALTGMDMNGTDAVEWKIADYLCKDEVEHFIHSLTERTWNFSQHEDIEQFTGEFDLFENDSWWRS